MFNNMRTTKPSTWIQNMMKNLQKKDVDEEKKLFNDMRVNVDESMYNYLGDIQKSINNINFNDILNNAKEIIQNDISTNVEHDDTEDSNVDEEKKLFNDIRVNVDESVYNYLGDIQKSINNINFNDILNNEKVIIQNDISTKVEDTKVEDNDAKFYSTQIETEIKWLDQCYELKNELRQKLIPDPVLYYRVDVDNPPTFLPKMGINSVTNKIGENYDIMKDGIKSIKESIHIPTFSNIMNFKTDETGCDIIFSESNNFNDEKITKILNKGTAIK